jgi:hypothetical protein
VFLDAYPIYFNSFNLTFRTFQEWIISLYLVNVNSSFIQQTSIYATLERFECRMWGIIGLVDFHGKKWGIGILSGFLISACSINYFLKMYSSTICLLNPVKKIYFKCFKTICSSSDIYKNVFPKIVKDWTNWVSKVVKDPDAFRLALCKLRNSTCALIFRCLHTRTCF